MSICNGDVELGTDERITHNTAATPKPSYDTNRSKAAVWVLQKAGHSPSQRTAYVQGTKVTASKRTRLGEMNEEACMHQIDRVVVSNLITAFTILECLIK